MENEQNEIKFENNELINKIEPHDKIHFYLIKNV